MNQFQCIADPVQTSNDDGSRIVHLLGCIDPEKSISIVNRLLQYQAENPLLPVHLQIFSPGGCMISALAVVDAIRHVTCPVFTYAIGWVGGVAVMILASGTRSHRYILPRTGIMLHQRTASLGEAIDKPPATVGFHDHLTTTCRDLLSAFTGQDSVAIDRAGSENHWMPATEALAFGIIDFVLEEGSEHSRLPNLNASTQ